MGLRLKFNLAILAALAAGFLVASIVLNRVYFDNAREEVLRNARIMMAAANAIRTYTVEELVPLLPSERDGKFVAASVPAYAAQKNFSTVQASFPRFSYREPALNPTNLSDRAQDWEADIINTFRNDATKADVVVERETATGPTLHLARPLVVRDQACLSCHNTSYDAPVALTRTYGLVNGFGWKLHETIGAQIVTIPMALPLALAHRAYVSFLIILLAVFAVVLVVLNLLLHYLVINPVIRVSRMADAVSLGEADVETYVKPGKDEISSLSVSFDRMRQSLDHAMQMLKG
jgi:HAMP domain-containing protein